MKTKWFLLLLLAVPVLAQRSRQRKGCKMPTTHSFITTNGNGDDPTSWDTGEPPAVAATGTLTLTGQPLDTETVVIDGKTYTFQDTLTDVDGNVHISHVDASGSLDNLIAAITLGAGSGTAYAASMTLHATVTAIAGVGDTMDATEKKKGTAGNASATTETLTNGSFGGGTLSGGTQWDDEDTAYLNGDNSNVAWSTGLDFGFDGVDPYPSNLILKVEDNYSADIGTDADPLRGFFGETIFKGTGTCYLTPEQGGNVIVDTLFGRMVLGHVSGTTGSICFLLGIKSGNVVFKGNTTVYDIVLVGPTSRLEINDSAILVQGHVQIQDGYAYIVGATVANKTVEVTGGFLEQLGRVHSNGRISVTGGHMKYRPYDDTPTTPDLYVNGGVLDLSKSLIPLTSADFGTTIIGPRGAVIGGALTRDAIWPPNYDLREEWP